MARTTPNASATKPRAASADALVACADLACSLALDPQRAGAAVRWESTGQRRRQARPPHARRERAYGLQSAFGGGGGQPGGHGLQRGERRVLVAEQISGEYRIVDESVRRPRDESRHGTSARGAVVDASRVGERALDLSRVQVRRDRCEGVGGGVVGPYRPRGGEN